LEGIIPTKINIGYYTIITLTKAMQLEFGRGLLSAFQKASRTATTVARATRAQKTIAEKAEKITAKKAMKVVKLRKATTKKPASKKKKVVEMEPAADIESDKIKESEVIYIRKVAPEPKRSICLAKKVKA
jgi:hypothetical protein